MRAVDLADHALDVFDRVYALWLGQIGSGCDKKLATLDRRVETFDAGSVGARGDEKILVAAGIERRLDLGQHLFDRNHLLAREIAATIRKDLIAEEHPG